MDCYLSRLLVCNYFSMAMQKTRCIDAFSSMKRANDPVKEHAMHQESGEPRSSRKYVVCDRILFFLSGTQPIIHIKQVASNQH